MRYRIFIVLLLLTAAASLRSQPGWSWQNPLPQGNTLNAMQSAGSSKFFAAGKQGTIVRSDDAGQTWQALVSGVTAELFALAFFNADTGMVVGAHGTLLRTRDGGDSWQKLASPDTVSYYSIYGYDHNSILVGGNNGTLLKTYDGGDSWETLVSHTTAALYVIASNGIDYTYAAGSSGALVRSRDGGSTWSTWPWAAAGVTIRTMVFPGNNIGLALGANGRIFRSQDKGENWTLQTVIPMAPPLSAAVFPDQTNGYLCGGNGTLYATTNAGLSWSALTSNTTRNLGGIAFCSSGALAAGGDNGTLLVSSNSGLLWVNRLEAFSTGKIRGLWLADENLAVAVGDSAGKGMIFRSGDGGMSWAITRRLPGVLLEDCCFVNKDSGFVVGASNTILRTSDGGLTWNQVTGLPVSTSYSGIHFVTSRIGTVVGAASTILRTTNAGVTWSNQTNSSFFLPLQAVHFAHPDTGLAVGYQGTILRTVNGGATWSKMAGGTTQNLNGVAFADLDHAVAVGANRVILASADRGATWSAVSVAGLPAAVTLEQVIFPTPQVGFITGSGGLILRSDNGGASWRLLSVPTTNSLNAVSFIDLHTGAVAGDNGTVLRTSDGGLPVELIAFSAGFSRQDGMVHLSWITATESNNYGFYLERRMAGRWETIAFIAGRGTTAEENKYAYADYPGISNGALFYRLRQVDSDGRSRILQSVTVTAVSPVSTMTLYQNHPNPFNAETAFSFYLPNPGPVRLILLDATGREVARILERTLDAGMHRIPWQAGSMPSGLYFYRLGSGAEQASGKLILLR